MATEAANGAEYGRIVVLKKDGTEGAFFGVTSDISIGRDRECDIRIKLTSVSRRHARIFIDENGNVRLLRSMLLISLLFLTISPP